jgi:hypothetical protein
MDHENALTTDPNPLASSDPDFSLTQINLNPINLSIRDCDSVMVLSTPAGCTIRIDSAFNEHYETKSLIKIPIISLTMLEREKDGWTQERMRLETDLDVQISNRRRNWRERLAEQMAFLQQNDRATRRCTAIYESFFASNASLGEL